MTAVTLTELSVADLPFNVRSGTAKRRKLVAIRYTTADAANNLNVATYVPGAADIEGIAWDTMNNAVTGTAATWSTTTISTAGFDPGKTLGELGVIVNMT